MSKPFYLVIQESFINNRPSLVEIIKSNGDDFHTILIKHRFTMVHPLAAAKAPDDIICQILRCFELAEEDTKLMEDLCRKFLKSLRSLHTLKAMDLSIRLKEEWKSKAVESGFSLTEETSHKEEVEILKRCKVEPFKPKHPVHVDQNHDNSHAVLKYEREKCLNNKPALEFEKHYTSIVHIIRDNNFFSEIANRLCEAGLVLASVVVQARMMKVPVMQAKAIMGAVHTMVKRCVLPVKILQNLIYVLNSPDFDNAFKSVVEALEKQSYYPTSAVTTQNAEVLVTSINNNSTLIDKSRNPTKFSDITPTTVVAVGAAGAHAGDDDIYQRSLKTRYRKLKDTSSSYAGFTMQQKIESKFFDLAVNINRSNVIKMLDLTRLPLHDHITDTKRTLIYGGQGIGKSSIINNLCKGWSNNSLLREYKYVILLKATDPNVGTANQLKDLLPEEIQDWMNPIIQADGEGTLFILDAYDEFSEESRRPNGFFDRLIQGDVLALASIIVTARPWCADEILHHFPNEVEILGFTPESRMEYIKHHLPDKDAEKFLSHPPMVQCTSIPFLLATLVEIFDNHELTGDKDGTSENVIPTNITFLFESVVRSLILKFSKNNDKLLKYMHGNINIPSGKFSSCLPHEIFEPFLEICSIAYKTLLMPSSDIPFRSDLITFGLVNVDTKLHSAGQKKRYRFLHSSIQEFLAAFCISRMEKDQIEVCIKSLQALPSQYQLMIEFLYGFGCINEIDRTKYKAYQVVTNFNIIRQLYESPNSQELIKSVYDQFKHSPKPCIIRRTWPSPSFADFWCLGRVIALSGCEWELVFTYRPIQNEHIEMLRKGFESIDNPEGRIKRFGFSLTRINEKGIEQICEMSKVHIQHHVTEAQFSANSLTSSVIPVLSKAMGEGKFRNLKKVILHQNVITAGGHMELIIALEAHCPNIEHVSFTELQQEEYNLLIQLKTLKIIELWRVSSCCVKASFKSLPAMSRLKQLEVHQTEVDMEVTKILPDTLPQSNIECLKLINCNIDCRLVAIIAKAVQESYVQRHCKMSIDLSDNIIRDDGREILSQLEREGCDILDSYKCNEFKMLNQFDEMKTN